MLPSYSQHHLLCHLGLLLTLLPILHHPRLLLGTGQRNEEALHMVGEQNQRSKKPSYFPSRLISYFVDLLTETKLVFVLLFCSCLIHIL
jgi:hypothetical protein